MSCYIVIYEENIRGKNGPSPKTSFYAVFYAEQDGNILEEKKIIRVKGPSYRKSRILDHFLRI